MGFTSFDTARASEWYSEDQVAMSITSSSIPREELFVTTKIHPRELGYNETLRAGRESAARFLGYVDVLLLHYPRCWKGLCGEGDFYEEGAWKESWRAIEDLRLEGTVRVGGGVSNFGPRYVQWSATIPTIWIQTSYTQTPSPIVVGICRSLERSPVMVAGRWLSYKTGSTPSTSLFLSRPSAPPYPPVRSWRILAWADSTSTDLRTKI